MSSIKIFNTVEEMRSATELAVGDICETLGYYATGDGGGAKYTVTAGEASECNDMSIISLVSKGENNGTLVARFMDEGKPVNVLQFGARNYYSSLSNNIVPVDRNDSTHIQFAIDYTDGRIDDVVGNKYYNAINTVIIPAGNYVICDQIKLPPYMQIQLDGDVCFYSFVTADDNVTLYKYNPEGVDETGNKTYFSKLTSDDNVYLMDEVFIKNERPSYEEQATEAEDYRIKYDNEYFVYKKGILKICYSFDENGFVRNPYTIKHPNGNSVKRFNIPPYVNTEVFCGNGSLSIHNKMNVNVKRTEGKEQDVIHAPCYICGIEVGSFEEFSSVAKYDLNSKGKTFYRGSSPIKTSPESFEYSNLCFSNLKICCCRVGFLSRAVNFFSNVFSNNEFFQNEIAFQFGIYGEDEVFESSADATNGTVGIVGQIGHDCGELTHFENCLFTGNKVSVNILLSAFNATFTSCHFDFENCVFRAAYRTKLIVDKCHIEGTGKALGNIYFPVGTAVTEQMMEDFNDRAGKDHMDEFVGILYAKPVTRFGGTVAEQYSYVDLDITSSRIIDNTYLPWSMFSFYNSGNATESDGHHRSHLYLNNNTYAYGPYYPLCYFTAEKDGIVHSPFLLSEFPEVECNALTEKQAVQNVPVVSRDSNEWASFFSADKPRGNHRFLSNRTLALKYPYFQNFTGDRNNNISGITLDENKFDDLEVILDTDSTNPFYKYNDNAKIIKIKDIYKECTTNEQVDALKNYKPMFTISLDDDLVKCEKGDTLTVALVTDIVSYCSYAKSGINGAAPAVEDIMNTHNVEYVEYDKDNNILGTYRYDVVGTAKPNSECLFDVTYPSTSACRHTVKNEDTVKVKLAINMYASVIAGRSFPDIITYTSLHAVLVEKE